MIPFEPSLDAYWYVSPKAAPYRICGPAIAYPERVHPPAEIRQLVKDWVHFDWRERHCAISLLSGTDKKSYSSMSNNARATVGPNRPVVGDLPDRVNVTGANDGIWRKAVVDMQPPDSGI